MSFTISQNLFTDDDTVITIVKCEDHAVSMNHIQPLLDARDPVLGVSANFGKHCRLSSIAISTLSRVLVVTIPARHIPRPKSAEKHRVVNRSRSLIQDHLLVNSSFQKYAFSMDKLAVALFLDLSIRIKDAVDMLSVTSLRSRHSLEALMTTMGGELTLQRQNVESLFFAAPTSPAMDDATQVALKAWAACRAATLDHMTSRFRSIPRIDTTTFSRPHLVAIATISRHAELQDAMKPTVTKNDVKEDFSVKKGIVNLTCSRFSTRVRKSNHQVVQIELEGEGTRSQVSGRARARRRSARVRVDGRVPVDVSIVSVTTIGRDDPTCAETSRQGIILETLQHMTDILSNPFFRALWFPKERLVWPKSKGRKAEILIPVHPSCNLNDSQRAAVQKILSDKDNDRIILVQGPPGTGKTTVIAASVMSHNHFNSSRGIWVGAHSNVAVKNIAEKFVKEGFYKFRLIVSLDFHFQWHEHLYEKVQHCLIRADMLSNLSVVDASRLLLDCKVILCTLCMFSNPMITALLDVVQVEVIILDEASQIECGDYIPIFHRFLPTLSKFVLIGDDKQLPPRGQEDISDLRSVFEFEHLRKEAVFLTTQYRMPHVIGGFISRHVYDGKLLTIHDSTTPKSCCFVDVSKGREAKFGRSWINQEEAQIILKLAGLYETKAMSYRIITPYDAQRTFIENELKNQNLKWEDKVFNVDSFQGNEDDHIIISVVRSEKLGFLRNPRRTNVMLTRCKQSMIICSNRAFLLGEASDTLIGKLASSLSDKNWITARAILNGKVALTA